MLGTAPATSASRDDVDDVNAAVGASGGADSGSAGGADDGIGGLELGIAGAGASRP